jgi:hypothetical protein
MVRFWELVLAVLMAPSGIGVVVVLLLPLLLVAVQGMLQPVALLRMGTWVGTQQRLHYAAKSVALHTVMAAAVRVAVGDAAMMQVVDRASEQLMATWCPGVAAPARDIALDLPCIRTSAWESNRQQHRHAQHALTCSC